MATNTEQQINDWLKTFDVGTPINWSALAPAVTTGGTGTPSQQQLFDFIAANPDMTPTEANTIGAKLGYTQPQIAEGMRLQSTSDPSGPDSARAAAAAYAAAIDNPITRAATLTGVPPAAATATGFPKAMQDWRTEARRRVDLLAPFRNPPDPEQPGKNTGYNWRAIEERGYLNDPALKADIAEAKSKVAGQEWDANLMGDLALGDQRSPGFFNPTEFLRDRGFIQAERATTQNVADALAGKGQIYDISGGEDNGQGIFYDPNAPRVTTPTIQDQFLRFQFEHTQKFGQSLNRMWSDDADAQRAGREIIRRYHAAGGTQNYTLQNLPATPTMQGRPALHRQSNFPRGIGVMLTAYGAYAAAAAASAVSGAEAALNAGEGWTAADYASFNAGLPVDPSTGFPQIDEITGLPREPITPNPDDPSLWTGPIDPVTGLPRPPIDPTTGLPRVPTRPPTPPPGPTVFDWSNPSTWPWGSIISGGGSVLGALLGSNASRDAADAQRQSAEQAIAEQRRQFDLTRSDTAPWRTAGSAALDELTRRYPDLTRKFTMADRDADPVYQSGLQFGLDQGVRGINARAIGSGMYDSGATLKALTQFGTDYGSTKAGESYSRFTADQGNVYNKLAGVAGLGQTAVNTATAAGMNTANNVSNALMGAGNASAAGIVGGANAWGSAATGVNNAYNTYQQNKILEALLNRNSGVSPTGGFNMDYFV